MGKLLKVLLGAGVAYATFKAVRSAMGYSGEAITPNDARYYAVRLTEKPALVNEGSQGGGDAWTAQHDPPVEGVRVVHASVDTTDSPVRLDLVVVPMARMDVGRLDHLIASAYAQHPNFLSIEPVRTQAGQAGGYPYTYFGQG